MLRVAVVGLGWWGCELAEAITKHPSAIKLVSCYSPVEAERVSFAARFGAVPALTFQAILDDRSIDAVILATPHSLHAEQVIAVVGAGKHVMVEKPFTTTLESAVRASEAAAAAGKILAVGHNRRLSAVAAVLKEMVLAQDFGEVLHIEANYSINSAMRYQPGFWRADRNEALGGALASLGMHMIDIMVWLFGPVKRVACLGRRVAVPVDIDDVTIGLLEFESGLTATIAALFAVPLTSHMRISGTAQVAEIVEDFSSVRLLGVDGVTRVPVLTPVDTVSEEIRLFAAACAGEARFPVTPAEATRNVAVMTALVASAGQHGAWCAVGG